jgi:hypothetical protein
MADIEKLIEDAIEAYEGEKFLGMPDEWLEPPHWWCKNGHRSKRYLKSERLRNNVCLVCFEPVMLGPKELPGVVPL